MSKDDIVLSPKHGLNPSMICCPICSKAVSIAIMGKLKDDAEAPRETAGFDLCDDCIKKCGDDKIFILGIDRDANTIVGYVQISRDCLNINVDGYVALMEADEFRNMFRK